MFKSPAFQLAAVGLVIYLASLLWPKPEPDFYDDLERPEIRISQDALAVVQQEFSTLASRPLTVEEEQKVIKWAVNQEVLHDYAVRLGIDSTEAARERLARVGEFLSKQHAAHESKDSLVEQAMDLGMSKRDPVTRKILIDSVSRLIKAGSMVQPIDEAKLNAWFELHKQRYQLPRKTRFSHVMLSRNVDNRSTEQLEVEARQLLQQILAKDLDFESAVALGDAMFVPSHFGLLTDRDYARQLGQKFPGRLAELPPGQWSGPVASRYGQHIIYIHERVDSEIPTLQAVRPKVINDYRHYEANQYLESRLDELRQHYDIYVSGQLWEDAAQEARG